MKKLIPVIYLALQAISSVAQECKNYYYLQNNKTIEMTIFNKKGEANGKNVYSISNVNNNNDSYSGTLNSELFDKKGKSIAKGNGTIQCKGGIMMVDAKMLLPQEQQEKYAEATVKANNAFIEYPSSMNPGDQLKDVNFDMDVDNHGLKSTVSIVVSDRKVSGKESVTTAAGTWDCFKITYNSKITIKTMGIGVPIKDEGTEWFAPGFGVVKTEGKHGGTAITSIK